MRFYFLPIGYKISGITFYILKITTAPVWPLIHNERKGLFLSDRFLNLNSSNLSSDMGQKRIVRLC